MIKPPIGSNLTNGQSSPLTQPWAAWFQRAWNLLDSIDSSGTTAQRPIVGLYVGRQFYDKTLGYPVYLHSVNPTVWHNGAGAAV